MPFIFFIAKKILPYALHVSQLPPEDPCSLNTFILVNTVCSGHWMPEPQSLSSPKVRRFHCHFSQKINSVRHLLPLIVLFQNNFSYKQSQLAEPRTQICSIAIRSWEVYLSLMHWGSMVHTVGNPLNIERVFKR